MLSWLSFEALARGPLVSLLEQLIKFTLPTTSLTGSHTLGHCTLALTAPQPDIRQPGTVPMPQSLLKSFKLAHPRPTYPASFFPAETIIKALAHTSPLLPLPCNQSWCFYCKVLCFVLCSPQGTVNTRNYKTLSSFSLLICLQPHYILTQGNAVKTQRYTTYFF